MSGGSLLAYRGLRNKICFDLTYIIINRARVDPLHISGTPGGVSKSVVELLYCPILSDVAKHRSSTDKIAAGVDRVYNPYRLTRKLLRLRSV